MAARRGRSAKTVVRDFDNSPDENQDQTEKDFNISFVKQIGRHRPDRALDPVRGVFTLLLWSATHGAERARARTRAGSAQALGFSDGSVLGFVLAEAFALSCAAGWSPAAGLVAGAMVEKGTGGISAALDAGCGCSGFAAIVLMSVAVGLLRGCGRGRLRIVDALAGP